MGTIDWLLWHVMSKFKIQKSTAQILVPVSEVVCGERNHVDLEHQPGTSSRGTNLTLEGPSHTCHTPIKQTHHLNNHSDKL